MSHPQQPTSIIGAALAAFLLMAACPHHPGPQPGPTASPTPEATVEPAGPHRLTAGQIRLHFEHLDKVPLRKGWDYATLCTLVFELPGEELSRKNSRVEIAIRGQESAPCLHRPCGKAAGLTWNMSSNLAHDDELDWYGDPEALSKSCGDGIEYSRRLPLGAYGPNGSADITVRFDGELASLASAVDSAAFVLRRPQSFGLSQIFVGSPWPRSQAPGWKWDAYSAHPWITMSVVEWSSTGLPQHTLHTCP